MLVKQKKFNKGEETKRALASKIGQKIKREIKTTNVYSDNEAGRFGVTRKMLHEFKPLILVDITGNILVIIPNKDMEKMVKNQEKTKDKNVVTKYIDSSMWYYGTSGQASRIFWRPVEKVPGINEPKRINEYINLLILCKKLFKTGNIPGEEECKKCKEHCLLRPFENQKKDPYRSLKEALKDDSKILFNKVKERIEQNLKVKVEYILSGREDGIMLSSNVNLDCYTVTIPEKAWVKMLYYPGKYDIDEMLNSLVYYLEFSNDKNEKDKIAIPRNATKEWLHEKLKEHGDFDYIYSWEKELEERKNSNSKTKKKKNFFH